ncbi:MAG TPA: NAD-dependent epimerase/dehydratase family protein [Solirubrobacteraceae bacterium]|jgi:UDP-glucose 4-epimerase|nr:NAD-dependent epimerase/dehydratase family protein [Solirubrobacteraceae bacterium]
MRTVVTGGAGFIGSHLVDALVARGDTVTIVDDLSSGRESNIAGALAAGAQLERADIRDREALSQIVAAAKPEAIFHLAAQVDVRLSLADPAFDARTNVEGTINVLESARALDTPRPPRVVFASTGGAIYGETDVLPTPESVPALPMAAYGQSKLCAELYLGLYRRLYGLPTIALRFGNVYGPRQDPHGEAGVIAIFCGRLRDGGRLTIFGDGSQTRDYVYVGDLVDALIRAGDRDEGGSVNVGTEEETSVLDIVGVLAELHGPGTPEPELAPARLGEIDRSCLDASRARETLGWRAHTPIAEGLRLTYEALQATPT